MLQLSRLSGHRCRPAGIAVAQGVDADAAAKINILFAVHVYSGGSMAAFQRHGEPSVGGHQSPVMNGLNFFQGHAFQILSACLIYRNMVPMPSSVSISIRME